MFDADWHIKLMEAEDRDIEKPRMLPFSLKGMTEKQEEAIRGIALQSGFKDMRGFHKWMKAADISYYDLIKVASP